MSNDNTSNDNTSNDNTSNVQLVQEVEILRRKVRVRAKMAPVFRIPSAPHLRLEITFKRQRAERAHQI